MTEIFTANGLLELRHTIGGDCERIPVDLIDEVIKALPDTGFTGTNLRSQLQGWRHTTTRINLTVDQLQTLERELIEYAHLNPSELGMVGRLSNQSAGKIVGAGDEVNFISSVVVLALSVRRFIVLHGVGTELSVIVQDDIEGAV